jgi:hypothetical protein
MYRNAESALHPNSRSSQGSQPPWPAIALASVRRRPISMMSATARLPSIDGRNRLAACKIAGVEPRFEKLNGADPAAYIVSSNLKRRNLKKGQQAMALAMIYPTPEKGGRGKKGINP